jgi:WD40 repeat protein
MQGSLNTLGSFERGFPLSDLEPLGQWTETGAPVTGAVALGETIVTTHGDGRLRLFSEDGTITEVGAHKEVILALARDSGASVVTGGDDGRFLRIGIDGIVELLASFHGAWVDCVAAHESTGRVACSVGRSVYIWRSGGSEPERFEHPSTVGGIAFDPKGKQIAVAHYGGATIWKCGKKSWQPTRLKWAGSHIGVTWSPDGRYLVTMMQESALHAWRLRDKTDMQMSGYSAKPRSIDWVGRLPYLGTSGADRAICWPFDGQSGPMGREPLLALSGGEQLATVVRALPGQPALLAGFQDGAVLMSRTDGGPGDFVFRGSTGVEVTAMAVTASVKRFLVGDAGGTIFWVNLETEEK